MVYMSLVVNLIGQRSRDVICRLSVSRDVIGCPSQDYTHPDDHNLLTYDMTPGFKPFTIQPTFVQVFLFCHSSAQPRASSCCFDGQLLPASFSDFVPVLLYARASEITCWPELSLLPICEKKKSNTS